ncbi:GumC family protein [Methylobrevis albus]|uniref:Lipopolysaccharide biosynthesis protein n=1 Tax=Methylobrevis albus TaxID=2793297 RepID=A0A931I0P2_9HYPH|nr:exopolysaccharide transport family protein [Methylobrevis albus]MBH0237138.1 hypothetical protein [Methylobrevis albus]
MSQGTASQTWEDPAPGRAATDAGLVDPAAIVRFVQRYWRRAAVFAGIALALAVVAFLMMPVRYAATALILVDPRTPRVTLQEDVLPGIGSDAVALESIVQVSASDGFVAPLFDKLGIVDDPEFNQRSMFGTMPSRNAMLERFRERIYIARRGITYVVEVSFTSNDREKAARYANTIAETFVAEQSGMRVEAATEAADWLRTRLTALAEAVRKSEAAVAAARAEFGIVDAGNNATVREQELSDLVQQVALARSQAEQARARYDQARIGAADPLSEGAQETSSNVLSDLRLQHAQVVRQMAELQLTYGERHPRLQSLRVQATSLERQITAEVGRQVDQTGRAADAARDQQRALETRLAELERNASAVDEASVRLRGLVREADANRQIYEEFLARFKSTNEQSSLTKSEARIVSRAAPPIKSTRMSPVILGAAALMLGTVAGFGSALVGEALSAAGILRRGERAPRAAATMSGPVASAPAAPAKAVPVAAAPTPAAPRAADETPERRSRRMQLRDRFRRRRAELGTPVRPEPVLDDASPAVAAAPDLPDVDSDVPETADHAGFDDALEMIALPWAVLFARGGEDDSRFAELVIAPATSRAGGRDVAVAVAAVTAAAGVSTVLLTTDAVAPDGSIVRDDTPGLRDLMRGDLPLSALTVDERGLLVLPAGVPDADGTAFDYLSHPALPAVLTALKVKFDAVVVEGPAAGFDRDLPALAATADGLLVVTEPGAVGERAAELLIEQIAPHEDCLTRTAVRPGARPPTSARRRA